MPGSRLIRSPEGISRPCSGTALASPVGSHRIHPQKSIPSASYRRDQRATAEPCRYYGVTPTEALYAKLGRFLPPEEEQAEAEAAALLCIALTVPGCFHEWGLSRFLQKAN
jgi:hypothetical protein